LDFPVAKLPARAVSANPSRAYDAYDRGDIIDVEVENCQPREPRVLSDIDASGFDRTIGTVVAIAALGVVILLVATFFALLVAGMLQFTLDEVT
jgi:hypothetical protein